MAKSFCRWEVELILFTNLRYTLPVVTCSSLLNLHGPNRNSAYMYAMRVPLVQSQSPLMRRHADKGRSNKYTCNSLSLYFNVMIVGASHVALLGTASMVYSFFQIRR